MLVSPDDVRRQLHIKFHDEDAHLMDLIEQASEIVRDYLKTYPDWTPETAPFEIKAATLIILTRLYEDRETRFDNDLFARPVSYLLEPYYDPAIA